MRQHLFDSAAFIVLAAFSAGCELTAPASAHPAPAIPAPAEPAEELPAPAACAAVQEVRCGDFVAGDTSDYNAGASDVLDSYAGVVGNYGGSEVVYRFVAPEGDVEIHIEEAGDGDHDVFVLEEVCEPDHLVARAFNSVQFSPVAGLTYYLVVDGYAGSTGPFALGVQCDGGGAAPDLAEAPCPAYTSIEQEQAPIQQTGAALPAGAASLAWERPTTWTSWVPFAGTPGQRAQHEGIDWIHADESVPDVAVAAAADGTVAYVRGGCPESDLFDRNQQLRECGSGWGNHVVVEHAPGVFTRYAHLRPDSVPVSVGDAVARGQRIGAMGNSGRSETRHLHFELGGSETGFDSCAPTRSFDAVHDPALLPGF